MSSSRDDFNGRVALVTGGASGIGRATVETLLSRGAQVMIADIDARGASLCESLASSAGERVAALQLDVRSRASVEAAVAATVERFGALDVLANVAGIYPAARLAEMSDEFAAETMDINFHGVLRMCRAALPRMLAAGRGSIVNVSSGAAARPYAGLSAYGASKAAVVAFSRALALEAAPAVRVNVVAPGATLTDTVREALAGNTNEAARAAARDIPLGRLADPADVAEAIAFLASDGAGYITGATLPVNGGSLMP